MNNLKILLICLAVEGLFSCSGKKDNPQPQPQSQQPVAAALAQPTQNSICTTGANQTATQSTVLFDWSDAANADSYLITIKNLLTGQTTEQTTAKSEIQVTLPRAAPFSWYVTSKSSKSTATAVSDTWKFYNSGVGVLSYAPFPATLTYPTAGQIIAFTTDSLKLTWTGSDPDGDLSAYDVYFGTSDSPALASTNTPANTNQKVKVSANTIYYWKIVSKDTKGNSSDSGINQFKIN